MDFTPLQQRKIQKYMILVLVGVLFIIAIVLWKGFVKEEDVITQGSQIAPKKIQIDFGLLEDSILKEFRVFERISAFRGELGRENPFVPYLLEVKTPTTTD